MASLQDMLMIGRSGILSQQERLAAISQNLSNVDTEGYHRRTTVLGTAPAQPAGPYSVDEQSWGGGVTVLDVVRVYNATQEEMLRSEQSAAEYQSRKADGLAQLQTLLVGSGETSLNDRFATFWSSWQDVANNPANMAARGALLEQAGSLTDYFSTLSGRFADFRDSLAAGGTGPGFSGTLARDVEAINSVAERIQNLNRRIHLAGGNVRASDLLDKRDGLLDDLSHLISSDVAADGTVTIDGRTLVSGDGATRNTLTLTDTNSPISLALDSAAVTVEGGSVRGWMATAAATDDWSTKLDLLANTLMEGVNALHTSAYDLNGNSGLSFFVGTDHNGDGMIDADTLAIHPLIHDPDNPSDDNPRAIAAATTLHAAGPPPIPNAGDGSAAMQLADLADTTFAALNGQTLGGCFSSELTSLGAAIQAADGAASDATTVSEMLFNAVQEEAGVNVDEEMVDMIAAQRAYEAAAKMTSTINELLDLVINRM